MSVMHQRHPDADLFFFFRATTPRKLYSTKYSETLKKKHSQLNKDKHTHIQLASSATLLDAMRQTSVATLLLFSPYRCSRLLRVRLEKRENRFGYKTYTGIKETDKACACMYWWRTGSDRERWKQTQIHAHTAICGIVTRVWENNRRRWERGLLEKFHSIYK